MNSNDQTPSRGRTAAPGRLAATRPSDPLRALLQRPAQNGPTGSGVRMSELLVREPSAQAADVSDRLAASTATTIPVGPQPWPIAIAANDRAYVGNMGDDTVSVIDTTTRHVLADVDLGSRTTGIAIAPDNRAFVTATDTSEVVILNGAEVVGRIAVPYPQRIAIAPDRRGYVTSGDGVTVIDTEHDVVLDTIPLGNVAQDSAVSSEALVAARPRGIAVAPNGRVYVADTGGTVVVIDPGTYQLVGTGTYEVVDTIDVGGYPYDIAVAPNGHAYVTENVGRTGEASAQVVVIDTADDQVIASLPVAVPYGVTAAPDGRVFVADPFTGSVAVIDSTTDSLLGSVLTGGAAPVEPAVAPDGQVWVTNTYSDDVSVLSPPRLVSLSPTQGNALGGTQVVLTGSDLSDVYAVTFGGAAATGLFANAAGTQLIVTAPAHAAGPVTVAVKAPLGNASLANAFTYVSAEPTLESVQPDQGLESGGTQVLLTGSNLTGATVTFGGRPASNLFYSADGRQVIATTPAHLPGTVDVVVSTSGGEATLPGGFTYLALPPALTSLSPTSGPVAGGTRVTITGTHLTGATSVTFNGVAGSNLVVNAEGTELAVTSPAGTTGSATVLVRTPGGTSNPLTFTYVPLPAPTGISPNSGSSSGGTVVTITGTNLGGATEVTFGGVPGTALSVNAQGTQLTVTTPAGSAGPTAVAVTTPGGTATVPGGFTYNDATTLTATPAVIRLAGLFSYVIPSVSATLTDSVTHAPLAGRTISFSAMTAAGRISLGTAVTEPNGVATRTNISVPATAVTATSYTATFAGAPGYLPSTATATLTFTPL